MTDETVVLAVEVYPEHIERIDEEIALREEETGVGYTRDQFVIAAVNNLLEQAAKARS